jgi:hypothetical protein
MFEEFGGDPRTVANTDYWCFVISSSAVQVRAPAPNHCNNKTYMFLGLSHAEWVTG